MSDTTTQQASELESVKRYCECVFPMLPGKELRPTSNCPIHRTLAARYDEIHSWADFYAALKVDSPNIESFEEWCAKGNLLPDAPT